MERALLSAVKNKLNLLGTKIYNKIPHFFFLLCISRFFFISSQPDSEIVKYLPDDAFYVLTLSRNFSESGQWTINSTTLASGFHLLPTLRKVIIYSLFPEISFRAIWVLGSLLSITLISIAFKIIFDVSRNLLNNPVLRLVLVLPFFSNFILAQTTSLMESDLVILIAVLFLQSILKVSRSGEKPESSIKIPIICFLAPLIRVDLMILFIILGSAYLINLKSSSKRGQLFTAGSYLYAGLFLGIVTNLMFYFVYFGEISSSSSRAKYMYSEIIGHDIWRPIWFVVNFGIPYFWDTTQRNTIAFITLVLFLVVIWFRYRNIADKMALRIEPVLFAGPLSLISLVLLYKFNSAGIFNWYAAIFLLPVVLSLALLMKLLDSTPKKTLKTMANLSMMTHIFSYAIFSLFTYFSPIWPSHESMRTVGILLRDSTFKDVNFGSWNSGIISFYSGAKIYNLDGLVNSSVHPYIRDGSYWRYIQSNVDYVVDVRGIINELNWPVGSLNEKNKLLSILEKSENTPQGWPTETMDLFLVKK